MVDQRKNNGEKENTQKILDVQRLEIGHVASAKKSLKSSLKSNKFFKINPLLAIK
jgi:hypothetical protein